MEPVRWGIISTAKIGIDLVQRRGAIHRRLTRAQRVEIGPVDYQDTSGFGHKNLPPAESRPLRGGLEFVANGQ